MAFAPGMRAHGGYRGIGEVGMQRCRSSGLEGAGSSGAEARRWMHGLREMLQAVRPDGFYTGKQRPGTVSEKREVSDDLSVM